MSAPDDDTRPVSVAELLARNGTIGSPPVGGRRRRRGRRNSDGVSVAELTGEIPVVPVEEAVYEEPVLDKTVYAEPTYEEAGYGETTYEAASYEEVTYEADTFEEDTYEADTFEEVTYEAASYGDVTYEAVTHEADTYEADTYEAATYEEVSYAEVAYEAEQIEPAPVIAPPLSSGAEQMAYDPVDESVLLADLVDQPAGEVEELRSYLRGSTDTLFSGGTVADDMARRGIAAGTDEDAGEYIGADPAVSSAASDAPRGVTGTLLASAAAVFQSLLAVAFGAGLFIAFDQLWRWNNLVALILSVLVVLTLAAAVRFVRKTEDIVSTLTAVAVGLLVTLGPLALQST
jgi:hypothetical protein